LTPAATFYFDTLTCVASSLSGDSPLLAIGLKDGTVEVTKVRLMDSSITPLSAFGRGSPPISSLAFSSDGRYLATASAQGAVVWDLLVPTQPATVQTLSLTYWESAPISIAFVPGQKSPKLGIVRSNGVLLIWDVEANEILNFTLPSSWQPKTVAFSNSGDFLFSASQHANPICAWRTSAPASPALQASRGDAVVTGLLVGLDATSLVVGYSDGTLGTWNLQPIVPEFTLMEGFPAGVVCTLARYGTGTVLAALVKRAGTSEADLVVWTGDGARQFVVPYVHSQGSGTYFAGFLSADTVLTAGQEGQIKIWKLRW
jgi:WD40 repeat protein